MQGVGAGLLHQVRNRAGTIAVLRRLVQGQKLEFLNRVLNRCVLRPTAQSLVRGPVYQETIEVLAQAVDDRIVAILG